MGGHFWRNGAGGQKVSHSKPQMEVGPKKMVQTDLQVGVKVDLQIGIFGQKGILDLEVGLDLWFYRPKAYSMTPLYMTAVHDAAVLYMTCAVHDAAQHTMWSGSRR